MSVHDVVLVGMACAFRGAQDVDTLWQRLVNAESFLDGSQPLPPCDPEEVAARALRDASGEGAAAASDTGTRCVLAGRGAEPDLCTALARGLDALSEGGAERVVIASVPAGAAVVLERTADAKAAGRRAYARLRSVTAGEPEELASVGYVEMRPAAPREPLAVAAPPFPAGDGEKPPCVRIPVGGLPDASEFSGAVADLAALLKTALSLTHKILAPSTLRGVPAEVPAPVPCFANLEVRPWFHDPALGPRRAALRVQDGVGAGTFLVLEEIRAPSAPGDLEPRPVRPDLMWERELILFSAGSREALRRRIEAARAWRSQAAADARLADVAHTLSVLADLDEPFRLAIVCSDLAELDAQLTRCSDAIEAGLPIASVAHEIWAAEGVREAPGKLACLFPGLAVPGLPGAYSDHLFELSLHFPLVREVLDRVDRRGAQTDDPLPTGQLVFPPPAFPEAQRNAMRSRFAVPSQERLEQHAALGDSNLCHYGVKFTNWAGWRLVEALRIPVDMLFGQSEGEVSALCAAGALQFPEMLETHLRFHIEPGHIPRDCALALVHADDAHLAPQMARYPDLGVALYLTPGMHVVGGDSQQLGRLCDDMRERDVLVQPLSFPAVHTTSFSRLASVLRPLVEDLRVSAPRLPVYSGVSASLHAGGARDIRDALLQNIDRPVLLWQTLRKMYADGARVFVQVGDGSSGLHRFAQAAVDADDVVAASLDVDYRSAISQLLILCSTLWTRGVAFDPTVLYAHRSLRFLEALRSESGADTEKPRMPFLGPVLHEVPGREIVVERTLDLAEDLHLSHHLSIGPDGIRSPRERLPFLPLTVSLEVIAEVAACLAPGRGLIGFEDVRASRWLELRDTDTLPLEITAHLLGDDGGTSSPMRIGVSIAVSGHDLPAVRGTVLFDTAYRADLELDFAGLEEAAPHGLDADALYARRFLWHGPLFHAVVGRPTMAARAVVGEFEVRAPSALFRSTTEPRMLTDPVVMDGAGQLVGLWARERGGYTYPISIDKLEIYCATPRSGTRVPARVEITEYEGRFLGADMEVEDGTGHVWLRARGVRDWVFHWPLNNHDVRRRPQRFCLSHEAALPGAGPAGVRRVDKRDVRDSDLDHIARIHLHPEEMERFGEFEADTTRRLQWLLGRVAAKDAVRKLIADMTSADDLPHPATIRIDNDARGRPRVQDQDGASLPVHVSISHSGDQAVAVAHTQPVGVDIEAVEPREAGFLSMIATAQDQLLLAGLLDEDRDVAITRLWCAKEAAGKALGIGASDAPRRFAVSRWTPEGVLTIHHLPSGRMLDVQTAVVAGGYVLAHTSSVGVNAPG